MWKAVTGYEGIYETHEDGYIRNTKSKLVLQLSQKRNGYLYVNLSKDGETKTHRAHRIVAIEHVPNPDNKPYVNHLNGIKNDIRAVNLEWTTASENDLHAFRIGLRKSPKAMLDKFGADHNRSKTVKQLSMNGELIGTYGSVHEAERETGILNQNISKCCNGKRKSAGGFMWQY